MCFSLQDTLSEEPAKTSWSYSSENGGRISKKFINLFADFASGASISLRGCKPSAAIFQVKLKTFLIATAFGIIPAVFVVSFFGAGMEELLQTNEALSFTSIFTPKIIAALLGLAGLVSAPAIYKNMIRRMEN